MFYEPERNCLIVRFLRVRNVPKASDTHKVMRRQRDVIQDLHQQLLANEGRGIGVPVHP